MNNEINDVISETSTNQDADIKPDKATSDKETKKEQKKAAKKQAKKEKKDKKENKKNCAKKTKTGGYKFLQHLLSSIAAICLLTVITGSSVIVPLYEGSETLYLSSTDEGRAYGDSVLFNTILGNEIKDVFRLVTIRTQMESDGKYDSEKIVDVAKFNNRGNINSNKEDNITAQYKLGDLLKWSRYGFDYEEIAADKMSPSANSLIYNPFDGIGNLPGFADPNLYFEVVVNRYKTVDGSNIEDKVYTWSDYYKLVEAIELAANDLYTNYTNYLGLTDYYNQSVSNIRYCVVMGEGDETTIYTNDDITANTELDSILSQYKGYGKYIYYDFDNMRYLSNTAITEGTFNTLLADYQYAFKDNSKLFIAVDMDMLATDSIATGAKGYNNYLPYYKQLYMCIAICIILYLAILVLCTIREGRALDENGQRTIALNPFDSTPIEIWAILTFTVLMLLLIVVSILINYNTDITKYWYEDGFAYNFIIILGIGVFAYDVILLNLYYSLVRRIKGHNIWKHTLLRKFVLGIKKLALNIYDNGNIIIRSWVPYAIIIIINWILVFGIIKGGALGRVCVLLIVLFDVLFGICIYRLIKDRSDIIRGMKKIVAGNTDYEAPVDDYHGDNKELAKCVNSISDAVKEAVDKSTKNERMKADLIANVSHDIRTPLTSIINYVDLIKRENLEDEKINSYIDVIDQKSKRLKTLTDDLIEASKASSGNVELNLVKMNFVELVNQAVAEFEDKFEEKGLGIVVSTNNLKNSALMADGKSLFRVMENLFGNVYKYALRGTRVFIDIFNVELRDSTLIVFQMKNISEAPLPDDLNELTERFIRGDVSRTSDGNGLGLSIAKSLTELMNGKFELDSEADLFKVEICFETVE